MFVYKLSGCGFKSRCSHLKFSVCTCFERGFSWHLGSYRVWIHSKMRNWLGKNIISCDILLPYTVIFFCVTLSENYKRIPKPLIFLVFLFIENTINQYILQNPQNKLCNIRKLEMKDHYNNKKCEVTDDGISDVSISEINDYEDKSHLIPKTYRNKGRKRVFMNENGRPHKKIRKSIWIWSRSYWTIKWGYW